MQVNEEQDYVEKPVKEKKVEKVVEPVKIETKWVVNPDFTKTCEACGAVMRGWACRENFLYCPMCGAKVVGK